MISSIVHMIRFVRHALRTQHNPTARSPHWPAVEHQFRALHPTCAACGSASNLNVHHKRPFHLNPALELDPTNLITLCMSSGHDCHILLGHGDNFKAYNPAVEGDAAQMLGAVASGDVVTVRRLLDNAKAARLYS